MLVSIPRERLQKPLHSIEETLFLLLRSVRCCAAQMLLPELVAERVCRSEPRLGRGEGMPLAVRRTGGAVSQEASKVNQPEALRGLGSRCRAGSEG